MINKDIKLVKTLIDEKIKRGFKNRPTLVAEDLYQEISEIKLSDSKIQKENELFAKIIFDSFENKLNISDLDKVDFGVIVKSNRKGFNGRLLTPDPGYYSLYKSYEYLLRSLLRKYPPKSSERRKLESFLAKFN